MNKLVIGAVALVLSAGVNAQDTASGSTAGTIGGVATTTVVAGAVAAGVLAAVVSNSSSTDVQPEIVLQDTCRAGDAAPVNGVCTGTTIKVNGSTTATATFTYPAFKA